MKQTGSLPKVNPPSTKTKTRKLNSSRTNLVEKEQEKPLQRLKSNNEIQQFQKTQTTGKPKSSVSRRPLSSKHKQTSNSITTTTSAKNQVQIKAMIENVFSHSKQLKQFFKENSIDDSTAFICLTNNQIFTLSLITMIGNKTKEQANNYIEKAVQNRILKNLAMEEQVQKCEQQENKIGSLIEKRLKALSTIL